MHDTFAGYGDRWKRRFPSSGGDCAHAFKPIGVTPWDCGKTTASVQWCITCGLVRYLSGRNKVLGEDAPTLTKKGKK